MAVIGDPIDELGERYAEQFRRLSQSPEQLMEALREDQQFAIAFCRADTVGHLRTWFTPRGAAWAARPGRSGPAGPEGIGVEWRYEGVHDRDGVFNGIPATGRSLDVRGYTIGALEEGRVRVWRYVDWAGVFTQLGLTLNWRIPVAAPGDAPGGPDGDGPP
jgi:hypothetical protein